MIDPTPAVVIYLATKGVVHPVAEAVGRLVSDPINAWAAAHRINILEGAQGRYIVNEKDEIVVNPKILFKILEQGANEDDEDMQALWSGLLATANDDTNLHFVEILSGITKSQALVIKKACDSTRVELNDDGLVFASQTVYLGRQELLDIAEVDIESLDQGLDDLNRKGLIDGGFDSYHTNAAVVRVTPTALALHFYARMRGDRDTVHFYKLKPAKKVSL